MSDKKQWTKGQRVLIRRRFSGLGSNLLEASVLEVSPSGQSVKLGFGESAAWEDATEYEIIEVLP